MEFIHETEGKKRFEILNGSKEMEIYQNLSALKASFSVFKGNFNELVQGLEHLKDPRNALSRYNYSQKENVNILLEESSRLLHNFLASAFSLVDHTRGIVNKLYDNQPFKDEYNSKLMGSVTNEPVHKFVKGLRNYTQHYTLPILGLEISLSEDLDFRVKMDVNVLIKWKKWGSSASYLDELGDSCCIETVAKEYFDLIQNFYVWLSERQRNIHEADFAKLQQMQQDLYS